MPALPRHTRQEDPDENIADLAAAKPAVLPERMITQPFHPRRDDGADESLITGPQLASCRSSDREILGIVCARPVESSCYVICAALKIVAVVDEEHGPPEVVVERATSVVPALHPGGTRRVV